MESEIVSFNHNISISDRKNISITGIKKINSFDDKEFSLDTTMGTLILKGSDLEIIKLVVSEGILSIKGKINSFSYTNVDKMKNKDESVISRLFK